MIKKQRLITFAVLAFLSIVFAFVLGWDTSSTAIAQDGECTPMAKNILESVKETCEATGRDQICYGSVSIEAEPQSSTSNFVFEQQGDIANVGDLATLRLQALDPVNSQWGVALIKVQASLPDSIPEDVTLLLFGNVEVANLGRDLTKVEMAVNTDSNVRNRATAENTQIFGSITSDATVIANGRITNPAGEDWIRIEFETAPAGYGWVLASSLSGDASSLTVVESSTEPAFGPMEAFTFSSQDDGSCGDVSNSGLMIQTPAGVGEINFFINEVDIQVGSTAFLTAQPGQQMNVSTLEGGVKVGSFGVTQNIPPGAQSNIPLNQQGTAAGMPNLPKPYIDEEVIGLGSFLEVELFEEDFDFVEAFNDECLEDFNSEFNDGVDDPFGDEVSTSCFLGYNDLYEDYFEDELPDECFDESGQVLDECLGDFNNEWPDECFDESGEISEYCLDADEYLDTLPDSCYNIYTGDIEDECVGAFDNIEALPDSCFDEYGEIADECFGASGIIYDLPNTCYDDGTGEILDECLDSFGSFDGDFDLGDECIDPYTGEISEACLQDEEFLGGLPDACFDLDTGEIYDECLDPYEEFSSAPDDCYDEDTGYFDEECYSGIIDDDFGYGTQYRDEYGDIIEDYYGDDGYYGDGYYGDGYYGDGYYGDGYYGDGYYGDGYYGDGYYGDGYYGDSYGDDYGGDYGDDYGGDYGDDYGGYYGD